MSIKYEIIKNNIVKFKAEYLYYVHAHDHYEIIYVISGQCMMSINNKDIVLNQGNCIVINRNASHNFYVNGENGCKINQLEVRIDDNLIDSDYVKLDNGYIMATAMNDILFFQSQIDGECDRERLIALGIEKVAILSHSLKSGHTDEEPLVIKAVEYIKDNYTYDIGCVSVARHIGISDRYLRKVFEKSVGMTPKDYISNLKMERAKVLLIHSTKTIADIAGCVGYNTIQYFSEVFKRRIGVSPSEFRTSNKYIDSDNGRRAND